jgi:hypothetical protein
VNECLEQEEKAAFSPWCPRALVLEQEKAAFLPWCPRALCREQEKKVA